MLKQNDWTNKFNGIKGGSQGNYYVKRLAGLPGETIGIDPPYLLVNEKKGTEPAIFSTLAEKKNGFAGYCPASSSRTFLTPLRGLEGVMSLEPALSRDRSQKVGTTARVNLKENSARKFSVELVPVR